MDTLDVNKLMKDFALSKQSRVIVWNVLATERLQGRRLRRGQGGSSPSNILGGEDGVAFIPQRLENVIANCHSERDCEGEKQKIRHQWPTHKLIL